MGVLMKITTLDKVYDFYCDWYFEMMNGNIITVFNTITKHEIISPDIFMRVTVYDMDLDNFGDFCDAIRKSGVIIE